MRKDRLFLRIIIILNDHRAAWANIVCVPKDSVVTCVDICAGLATAGGQLVGEAGRQAAGQVTRGRRGPKRAERLEPTLCSGREDKRQARCQIQFATFEVRLAMYCC